MAYKGPGCDFPDGGTGSVPCVRKQWSTNIPPASSLFFQEKKKRFPKKIKKKTDQMEEGKKPTKDFTFNKNSVSLKRHI